MLLIAIPIFLVGFYLPYWISKRNIAASRQEISWRQAFFELSGLLTCFVVSFILTCIVVFSTSDKYLLNKDVVFGIEANELAEKWGFQEGDKILRINGEEVIKFDDIILTLINSDQDPIIDIERNGSSKTITLNSASLLSELVDAGSSKSPFNAKNREQLSISETSKQFSDVLTSYKAQTKLIPLLFPLKENRYGGYMSVKKIDDFRGYLFLLSSFLILLGLINLIPLPGFSLGNSLIVVVQKASKKQYDQKRLKRLRRISLSIFAVLFIACLVAVYFDLIRF